MKNLFITVFAMMLVVNAYAQTDTSTKKMMPPDFNKSTNDGMDLQQDSNNYSRDTKHNLDSIPKQRSLENHPDGVMMKGGKMWLVKNQKMYILDKTVTLSNGTIVTSDGSYMNKEGIKRVFREGEHMDMTGKIIPMK
ncbi:MAG: hypothetical protein IPO63_00780 [Bacteroidetes bacterium]|nr:hypothetical protein [Bacteroidota bacterium]